MFFDIMHKLQSLGQEVMTHTMVLKILRSLPVKWEVKWIAIEEANNLRRLIVEVLMCFLPAYE